eukprot:8896466-Pyramimonas_sp.AAC.1
MSESKAHGMASEIRALKDSEEFDLAGYDGAQVTNMLNASFSSPIQLPAGHMVRVTFVIGGGKKVRQKYPETLAKDIAAGLSLTTSDVVDTDGYGCKLTQGEALLSKFPRCLRFWRSFRL